MKWKWLLSIASVIIICQLYLSLHNGIIFGHDLVKWIDYYYSVEKYDRGYKLAYLLAAAGNPQTQYYVGLAHEYGTGVSQNTSTAIQWFRRAAQHGDGRAWLSLGQLYDEGTKVPQNYQEALVCYKQAANKGVPRADGLIGVLYEFGRGVPRSQSQAMQWIEKEKGQWLPITFMKIGKIYEKGQGPSPDVVEAFIWYKLASLDKHFQPAAKMSIDRLRASMTPAQIAEAQRRFTKYLKRYPVLAKASIRK